MNTTASSSIYVHRQQFDFEHLPLYYYDNNPFLSHVHFQKIVQALIPAYRDY